MLVAAGRIHLSAQDRAEDNFGTGMGTSVRIKNLTAECQLAVIIIAGRFVIGRRIAVDLLVRFNGR